MSSREVEEQICNVGRGGERGKMRRGGKMCWWRWVVSVVSAAAVSAAAATRLHLAIRPVDPKHDPLYGLVNVNVIKDHDRALAAELKGDVAYARRRADHHVLARRL